MVQLSATRCSCIAILWVSLVSLPPLSFVLLLNECLLLLLLFISLWTQSGNFWIHPRTLPTLKALKWKNTRSVMPLSNSRSSAEQGANLASVSYIKSGQFLRLFCAWGQNILRILELCQHRIVTLIFSSNKLESWNSYWLGAWRQEFDSVPDRNFSLCRHCVFISSAPPPTSNGQGCREPFHRQYSDLGKSWPFMCLHGVLHYIHGQLRI
jgi:hypothetical protein